jgi:septal ring factor EnvC (AmiA/AmiB activator)|tara:strand:- start:50 stop:208 length:159 start_codon:yes stop_codon:yes gene_type:complete
MNDKYEASLESERRKWEFRYKNQNKRIKELESKIQKLRKELKDLKKIKNGIK